MRGLGAGAVHAACVRGCGRCVSARGDAPPPPPPPTHSHTTPTPCSYPSQLAPHLYLGDWSHAEAVDRLDELGVKRVVTIHNNPGEGGEGVRCASVLSGQTPYPCPPPPTPTENLRLPSRFRRLAIELADVDTADIAPHLHPAHEVIEEGRLAGEGERARARSSRQGAGRGREGALSPASIAHTQTHPPPAYPPTHPPQACWCTAGRGCLAQPPSAWPRSCAVTAGARSAPWTTCAPRAAWWLPTPAFGARCVHWRGPWGWRSAATQQRLMHFWVQTLPPLQLRSHQTRWQSPRLRG